jgi:hypothetical protein
MHTIGSILSEASPGGIYEGLQLNNYNVNYGSAAGLGMYVNQLGSVGTTGNGAARGLIYVLCNSGGGINSMHLGVSALNSMTVPNNHLVIRDNGNVGIGITNPSQKLDVSGNINLTGDIYKNSSLLKFMTYTSGGNITGLTTDIPIDNTYGMSVIYWKLRITNSTLIRFNMLLRFQIGGTFQTASYEKNVMATYNNNGTTINYISTGGGDGPIILYYSDNFQDNAGEIRVFSPGLISRTQVQYDSSYTYGGIGATRTYGSAHYTGTGTQITAIRLVIYQFDASNVPTGATGSYSVIGIPT